MVSFPLPVRNYHKIRCFKKGHCVADSSIHQKSSMTWLGSLLNVSRGWIWSLGQFCSQLDLRVSSWSKLPSSCCRTDMPVTMLAVSQGTLSPSRTHLHFLSLWPSPSWGSNSVLHLSHMKSLSEVFFYYLSRKILCSKSTTWLEQIQRGEFPFD